MTEQCSNCGHTEPPVEAYLCAACGDPIYRGEWALHYGGGSSTTTGMPPPLQVVHMKRECQLAYGKVLRWSQ